MLLFGGYSDFSEPRYYLEHRSQKHKKKHFLDKSALIKCKKMKYF